MAAIGLSFIAVGIHSGTILLFEVGTDVERIEKSWQIDIWKFIEYLVENINNVSKIKRIVIMYLQSKNSRFTWTNTNAEWIFRWFNHIVSLFNFKNLSYPSTIDTGTCLQLFEIGNNLLLLSLTVVSWFIYLLQQPLANPETPVSHLKIVRWLPWCYNLYFWPFYLHVLQGDFRYEKLRLLPGRLSTVPRPSHHRPRINLNHRRGRQRGLLLIRLHWGWKKY